MNILNVFFAMEIIGYEGLYTFDGEKVRSVARQGTSGKVLKWRYGRNGRPYVNLCKNGKHTTFYKHMLVWMDAHQQAIPQAFEIHHIDGDFTNNDPSNLQLLTREEHQRLHAETREICQKNNYRSKAVNCYKDGQLIAIYPSTHEAARQLGLYNYGISKVANGKLKTCGGYQFSWAI